MEILLVLLALCLATGTNALYFDCHLQATSEDCQRNEYCVWSGNDNDKKQTCTLSAQSLYLLCLTDQTIPEESCLPDSARVCNQTRLEKLCNLQTPCEWKDGSASCEERIYAQWTEVPTASPTASPRSPESRAERVRCCAHSSRVCFPSKQFQEASSGVKAREVANAKHACVLPNSSSMNQLCVQERAARECPSRRRRQ